MAWTGRTWRKRRGPESNRRIAVLQTAALPLGYRAEINPNCYSEKDLRVYMACQTVVHRMQVGPMLCRLSQCCQTDLTEIAVVRRRR